MQAIAGRVPHADLLSVQARAQHSKHIARRRLITGHADRRQTPLTSDRVTTHVTITADNAEPQPQARAQREPRYDLIVAKVAERIALGPALNPRFEHTGARAQPGQLDGKQIDQALLQHLITSGQWQNAAKLRATFTKERYVELDLMPPAIEHAIAERGFAVLHNDGIDRREDNPITGTARNHRSLGQPVLRKKVPLINILYRSPVLMEFLKRVTGVAFKPLPRGERLDETVLHEKHLQGSTLGPHLDPSEKTVVMVFQAPPPDAGGELRFLPVPEHETDADGLADPADVANIWARNPHLIQARQPTSHKAYIINSAYDIHMVAPLTRDLPIAAARRNLTMSWASVGDKRPVAYKKRLYDIEVGLAFPEFSDVTDAKPLKEK